MTEPIVITVKRQKCPHCGRTWAHKATALKHMARCWSNPLARGCKTCAHYEPGEDGEWEVGYPGSPEFCDLGVSLDGQICEPCDGHGEIPFGPGTAICRSCDGNPVLSKPGPIVHCDLWEAA